MNEANEHLLQDLEVNLVRASTGKRFANHLVDLIIFYIFYFGIYIIYFAINPPALEDIDKLDASTSSFSGTLIIMVFYGIFMGVYEGLFKGRTLGKLITNTKAVNLDGTTISFKTAMLRGLCRAVPFDALSAFANVDMWHDKWSDSCVVDVLPSTLPIEDK